MIANHLRGQNEAEFPENSENSVSVPASELFSNQFLADLDKIWALRSVIPDPKHPPSDK